MMRGTAWLAVAALATVAFGQTKNSLEKPESRIDQIWDFANNRIVNQLDGWWEDGEFPRVTQLLKVQALMYPADYDVVTNLGWMLENVDRYDEALAVYIRYRMDNPNTPDGPLAEAEFYFRRKAYAKVIPLLEPALPLKPHPNGYRLLAHAYEKTNLFADSRRVWDLYISLHPNDATAKLNRARVDRKARGEAPPRQKGLSFPPFGI